MLCRVRPCGRIMRSPHRAMNPVINLVAISSKGRSRIGKSPCTAVVEQKVGNRLFIVFSPSHCRWILEKNDSDFVIITP